MSYLRFDGVGTSNSKLTLIWWVMSSNTESHLGNIQWLAPWRKYCFYPTPNTVYDTTCLREIADFCENQTRAHKLAT